VRARAFSPAKTDDCGDAAQVREAIYQERLFELTAESKRRQDLIRAGALPGGTANRYLVPVHSSLLASEAPGYDPSGIQDSVPDPQTQIETTLCSRQNAGY